MNIRTLFLTTLLVALNQVNGKYITGWCNITSCNNNGKCVQLDTSGVSKYWCLCADGFSGDHCEQPPCPDICMNDGVCTKPLFGTMSDYYCKCPAGYEGQYCEKEVETSICDSDPCGEYGTCMLTSSVEDFRCDCMNGWQGPNCSEKSPCPAGYCNRGTCSIENGNPVCSCPDNFTGSRCELYADLCAKNPCQNGATCHSKLGDFDCICKPGFIGGMCEYNATALFAVDKCSQEGENSCQNGGLCRLNTYAQWTCVCPPMFEGSHCQDDVNECDRLAPCLNGATCHNYDGSFQCICPIGYDGEFCEIKEEYCSPNPCQHGGQCVSEGGRAFCHCPPGKIGNFCEKIDACIFNPCKNNASCHTEVSTGDYQCACPKGFTGKHCDQDVDECAISANACYNNGTCVNKYGGYECRCPESFSGAACEKVDLMCSPNPCLNNGQCMDLVNDYECACLDGFYGDNCEFGKSSQTFCKGGDCQNGGSCHFGVCSCQKGFSGILCEESDEKKNHCLSNPCHHGICLENGDDYRCHCYPGFTGRDCHINFDDCKPGLCLNDGTCVDGDDSFTCSCKKGFSGKHCEERIDMEKFNHTETRNKELCAQHGCSSLAGNGRCDQQCNHFACGFDGGDCSAKAKPYEKCETASYCARAFHDGYCDEICNNENCLFDGFDCSGSPKKCPYAEYCENNYNNGHCNSICNTTACGFDGGDCENKEKEEKLNGEIVLVVLTSPNDFRRRANTFLMTLSATLRASVKIRSDSEGPMVYEWIDGQTRQRIILDREQPLSVQYAGVIRGRRAANEQGVIVWLTVDMTNCKRDCFSDIATVADFLGRAEAQNELEQLGMPIKEARIDHRENEETSSVLAVFLVIAAVLVFVTFVVFSVVNRDRTRKRRIISAPTWYPPTDTQYKAMQQQAMDFNFHQSLYGSQGELGVKRTRIEGPQVSSFFNGAYSPPLIVPNQVFAKPHTPTIFPDFSQLHEQASSGDLIPLPINRNMVNERNGPGGVTPLILLAKNKEKDVKLIIKDMDNLYKAGANLDAQDEAEQTALFIAVKMGRLEVAQKLLGLGANPTKMDYNDSTPLHQAVHNCDLIMVRELLKNDAVKREIHEVDKFGRTALMASAFTDILSTEVAAALIEAGADPSYQGDKGALTYRGRSATHYAAQCGNTKMLKFLIEKGANKDAQDLEECTPLILAVRAAQQASVEILVAAGASQEISDQTEASPRSIAKEMELDSILEILEKARKQYDNMVEVPLPETKPRTMKQTSKRAPQKRKHQPLTPPHSDGTSTPPETSHLDRPLICPPGLDSPHSSSSNKTASPNYSHPMGTQGFPRPSPPYDCDWSTLMPPGTAYAPTCQLQQTFTSDYNSASSSFDTSSFNFGGDYSNASSSW